MTTKNIYVKHLREMKYSDNRITRILDISNTTLKRIDNGLKIRSTTIIKIENNYTLFIDKIKNY